MSIKIQENLDCEMQAYDFVYNVVHQDSMRCSRINNETPTDTFIHSVLKILTPSTIFVY